MTRLNIIFLVLFLGLVGWIVFLDPGAISTIQRGGLRLFAPVMKTATQVDETVAQIGTSAPEPEVLQKQLQEMKNERDRLKLEIIQLDDLLHENNQLRRALQYSEKSSLKLVYARVINRKPTTWYNTLVIDKGSKDGIALDYPVIVPVGDEAGLVGKVSQIVGDHAAVVLLLTDEMCQVSARLQSTQDQGILSGQRAALRTMPMLNLRYLPKEAEVAVGQKVFSSGTGELFPANLYLGDVVSFESGALDVLAKVRPGVKFDELNDVFIIQPAPNQMPTEPADNDPPAEPQPSAPAES